MDWSLRSQVSAGARLTMARYRWPHCKSPHVFYQSNVMAIGSYFVHYKISEFCSSLCISKLQYHGYFKEAWMCHLATSVIYFLVTIVRKVSNCGCANPTICIPAEYILATRCHPCSMQCTLDYNVGFSKSPLHCQCQVYINNRSIIMFYFPP